MAGEESRTGTNRNTTSHAGGGLMIILSGPSGVGKGTICKSLLRRDENLALSISATTRTRGANEVDGRDYFFHSEEEFQKLVDEDGFLEWAEVHGRRYGTMKTQVQGIMDKGKDCILEIDVQGGLQIAQKMGGKCLMIFIKAPSEDELVHRIAKRRRESEEDIKRRMITAQWEMTQEEKYQHSVVNDELEKAVIEVLEIIREERKAHASAIH
ncbi:MAG: guanylate kinase [Clostridiales bacterium]|nr:guanylate kinase [Clostridiales bacterium]